MHTEADAATDQVIRVAGVGGTGVMRTPVRAMFDIADD
jgi:hypothetical protein